MHPLLALHEQSGQDFLRQLAAVRPDQWALPSPCAEWSVRDVAAHVVGFNFAVAPLLAGKTVADLDLSADPLGPDPVASASASLLQAHAAFSTPGALDVLVHHPAGDIPAEVFLGYRVFDFVVHSWDLADPTGAAFEVDPELVAAVLAQTRAIEGDMAASGMFGTPQPFAADADAVAELVARCGRHSVRAPA